MNALHALLASALVVSAFDAASQARSLEEAQAGGAAPLSAQEVKDLVTLTKAEFTAVNGTSRRWTHEADGSFVASRDRGPTTRRSGRGTWSVKEDGAYCLNFDWGSADTDGWCRLLYKLDDGYYAFGRDAKPDTRSGRYVFSK